MFVRATHSKLFHKTHFHTLDYFCAVCRCGFIFPLQNNVDILFNSQDDMETYIEQHTNVRMCKHCAKYLQEE